MPSCGCFSREQVHLLNKRLLKTLQKIIENFTKDSCLLVVICTDAFGMGVNCTDVRLVIHYGVPSDAETYVQQIGRSGRDGRESYAVILHSKKKMENCNEHVTSYVENKRLCRRDHLFRDFENTTHARVADAVMFASRNVPVVNA